MSKAINLKATMVVMMTVELKGGLDVRCWIGACKCSYDPSREGADTI